MENKRSFLLYVDSIHVVNKLPDEVAGKLLKLILAYVNDENPVVDDPLLEIAFEPIKQQLKRDLMKWKSIREKRSEAGKIGGVKSGIVRKQNNHDEANESNDSFVKQIESNESVIVNVNDNVNDIKENNTSKFDFDGLLIHFNNTFNKRSRIIPEKVKKSYLARLKEGYTSDDIHSAMKNASLDKWHRENQFHHCTLEFFSRAEKIDKFANATSKQNNSPRYIPTT
jgi:hypothetical protein